MKVSQIFISRLRRGLRQLWYRDIWHLQPSAPLNWRYLLPNQSSGIRLHRTLWWRSRYKLPGLLWLPLEFVRWTYWQLILAPRKVREAVAYCGQNVEERFCIGLVEQESRISFWAKAWCINPYTAYNWQLYRLESNALAIVYDNQTSAYHAMQNRETGASKADHRLLGDKIALAELLTAHGIPMVETARVSNGDWRDIETALVQYPKLFCKLRSGNQGESAFAVWRDESGLRGLCHDSTELLDEDAVRNAWQILTAKGAVLIQPLLANHPAFASVAADDVAVTLRVVTRERPEGISVWWAELQVPGKVSPTGDRGFWRYPVSVDEGSVSALNWEWFLKQDWQDEYDALWSRLCSLKHVPFWGQICDDSLNAHQALPKVWAIAWDWVITPEGPVLLEGNGGWGLCEVQQQGNDLLAPALNSVQIV